MGNGNLSYSGFASLSLAGGRVSLSASFFDKLVAITPGLNWSLRADVCVTVGAVAGSGVGLGLGLSTGPNRSLRNLCRSSGVLSLMEIVTGGSGRGFGITRNTSSVASGAVVAAAAVGVCCGGGDLDRERERERVGDGDRTVPARPFHGEREREREREREPGDRDRDLAGEDDLEEAAEPLFDSSRSRDRSTFFFADSSAVVS